MSTTVYWKILVEFQGITIAAFALLVYVLQRRHKIALGRPRTGRLTAAVVVVYALVAISLGLSVASLIARR